MARCSRGRPPRMMPEARRPNCPPSCPP